MISGDGEEEVREADNENPRDKTFQGQMILSSGEKRIGKSWKEALEKRRPGELSDKKLNDQKHVLNFLITNS